MEILDRSHPSYGLDQAWFLFAVRSPRSDGFCRLLLVEARSRAAVQAVEAIVAEDGQVSGSCELMTVHRQCPSIGIRSGLAEEVPYAEFMVDMVDPARYSRNPGAMAALQAALTPEERSVAIRRLSEPALAPAADDGPAASPDPSSVLQDAEAALIDLGFKRPQARRMIEAVGRETVGMDLEQVLKACLRSAA